jgi:hypothetical protein
MMKPLATCVRSAGVRRGDIPVEYFRPQCLYILKVVRFAVACSDRTLSKVSG